jgi:hypothetical protein
MAARTKKGPSTDDVELAEGIVEDDEADLDEMDIDEDELDDDVDDDDADAGR